jgi:predicted amidohydrolase YtcJ
MKTQFINGLFYLMTAPNEVVTELWTEAGKIIGLGPQPGWKADKVIDVQGSIGFPGFVDAHLHILGYGEKLSLLNLEKNSNSQTVLQLVKDRFNGKFLYCQGHVEQGLTKFDLDKISQTVPILLRHADYHGATVNSALLMRIGLSNHPNGILHEDEAMKAVQAIPKYTRDGLIDLIDTAIKQLHQYGITGGHSDDLYYFNGFVETVAAFETALTHQPFRTHLLIHHQELDAFLNSGRTWLDQSPYLQLGAIKTFYDGTISSRTALMTHPYQGTTQYGQRLFTEGEWLKLLIKIRQAGLPIAIHTIGDQALLEVAKSLTQYPVKAGLHDRIIHASFANDTTIALLKKLPLIFDIQPQFLSSDLPWGLDFISPKTTLIYPWKSYMDAGLILCGSSDAPVEIPDPLLGIQAAYLRQSIHNGAVYQPEQRLSMYEAVKLYTTGANAPTYDLAHRGTLKVGHLADFTFLNADIIKHPETLAKAKVTLTIVDDHIVYTTLNN